MPGKKHSIEDLIQWAHAEFEPIRMQASYILRLRFAKLTSPEAISALRLCENPPPEGPTDEDLTFIRTVLDSAGLFSEAERQYIPSRPGLGFGLGHCDPTIRSMNAEDTQHAWGGSPSEAANARKMEGSSKTVKQMVYEIYVLAGRTGVTVEELAEQTQPLATTYNSNKKTSWEATIRRRVTSLAEEGLLLNTRTGRGNLRNNSMDIYIIGYDPCAGKLTSRKGLISRQDFLLEENAKLREENAMLQGGSPQVKEQLDALRDVTEQRDALRVDNAKLKEVLTKMAVHFDKLGRKGDAQLCRTRIQEIFGAPA